MEQSKIKAIISLLNITLRSNCSSQLADEIIAVVVDLLAEAINERLEKELKK